MIIRQRKQTNGSLVIGKSNDETLKATALMIKLRLA